MGVSRINPKYPPTRKLVISLYALREFYSRRRDALKVFFDGSGMFQFYKRLDRATFKVLAAPTDGARHIELDDATLEVLLDGIDVDAPPRARRRRVH